MLGCRFLSCPLTTHNTNSVRPQEGAWPTSREAGPVFFKLLPSFHIDKSDYVSSASVYLNKLMNLVWKNPWQNSWGFCMQLILMSIDSNILHTASPLPPPCTIHRRKSLIFAGRKKSGPVNLDPRELKDEPYNSGCMQRIYNQNLEGRKKKNEPRQRPIQGCFRNTS